VQVTKIKGHDCGEDKNVASPAENSLAPCLARIAINTLV
jgi:hypothetical protein